MKSVLPMSGANSELWCCTDNTNAQIRVSWQDDVGIPPVEASIYDDSEPSVAISVESEPEEFQSIEKLLAKMEQSILTYAACSRYATSKLSLELRKDPEERLHAIYLLLRRLRAGSSGKLQDAEKEKENIARMHLGRRATKRFKNFPGIVRKVTAEIRLARVLKSWQKDLGFAGAPKQGSFENFHVEASKLQTGVWDGVDVFDLDRKCSEPLALIFLSIWKEKGLSTLCKAKEARVMDLVRQIEKGYIANPYHNRMHAGEVMLMAYQFWSLMSSMPAFEGYFEEVDLLVVILAAAIHDIGHPGVSNDFMVKTKTDVALRYHDMSVLENFHLATAFEIMRDTGVSMLEHNLPSPPVASLRSRVVEIVLATDMAVHKSVLESLESELRTNQRKQDVDKLVLEKAMVHMADIGHPLRPVEAHQRWTKRINEEFFAQGDREKELGFTPLPLLDRSKAPPVGKGQLGFLKFVIEPLWLQVSTFLGPRAKPASLYYQRNMRAWQAIADTEPQQ